ncbi:MAG: alpha/beta fold hydrolase [Vicinamibacteria bacterium]
MTRTAIVCTALAASACMPPEWGANAVLHPYRKPLSAAPDIPYEDVAFTGDGEVALRGWRFPARGPRRGLVVYLHGIGDDRAGGIGLAKRFGPLGWDVLAYDSRAHGASGGDACTYGAREKRDLVRVLDEAKADRVVLFGSSLGAAVALQAAPLDARVRGVIAQSPFSSLEEIARDRAPWFATDAEIARALDIAQMQGRFTLADASPVASARDIRVPVLLIHGVRDRDTRPAHSERIAAALAGPKRLLLVPGAGHDDTLRDPAIWSEIEGWLAALPLDRWLPLSAARTGSAIPATPTRRDIPTAPRSS